MYNKYLPIFIEVANAGSFSKASEKMYISVPAIIKQINHLENDLDLKLFNRSHTGLSHTKEGQFIYEKSQYIIEFSNSTLQQAKDIYSHRINDISIGISQLRHINPFIDLIKALKSNYPNFNMSIINFNDQRNEFVSLVDQLGKNIDCFFGLYSLRYFNRASFYHIRNYNICLAVSINNPFSSKEKLTFEDLKGHKIIMVERGDTSHIDNIRDMIEQDYPEIEIINVPAYDIDTFNLCNSINGIMITVDIWNQIHPLLVNVPLETHFYVPYGLIYPLNPDKKVREFVESFKEEFEKGK